MSGIVLDRKIEYRNASLRYFKPAEYHTTRYFGEDVLLLVFDGILRFRENGVDYEVAAGQYHIQHHDTYQEGIVPSDSPCYLYVHFTGEWAEQGTILHKRGNFSYHELEKSIKKLDHMNHHPSLGLEQTAEFFAILSALYRGNQSKNETSGSRIAAFLEENYASSVTLDSLAEHFHFSRNHVINIFKSEYGMTPFEYLRKIRINEAKRLLEITSESAEKIAVGCGFNDYAHFYKIFKKYECLSPKEWRNTKRLTQ